MIAYHQLLLEPAKDACISIPENLEEYDQEKHPHWHVFCMLQLGSPMPDSNAHFHNAHIVSRIPDEEIYNITAREVVKRGFKVGFNYDVETRPRFRPRFRFRFNKNLLLAILIVISVILLTIKAA